MISRYVYGQPLETGAVVMTIPKSSQEISILHMQRQKEFLTLSCQMDDEDIVYGLGEQVRGINKRGFTYISYATDDPNHTENKHSLYAGHNFLILSRKKQPSFGIFIDYPGKVIFNVGETKRNELHISAGSDCTVYIIEGECLTDIARQFRELTGRSYIAPKWAFGYQQSRWGYQCEDDIRRVVDGYHSRKIPLDAVYLDIDYMDHFKDFTIDNDRFPDFSGFTDSMKNQGVHLVPIIDAGVKIEKDYPVYEEGVQNNYFCKDEDGRDFVGAVWPGKSHFPDFLNSRARAWFGHKYKWLMDQGIEGFWNDMNEPALFYSEKRLERIMDEILTMKNENLDLHSFYQLTGKIDSLSNNPDDHKSFYHDFDGIKVRHDKVHNLYGFYMTKAASEAFDQIAPDKRTLLFSRSSYIGMHRYGGIWTGDNASWWSHLLLSIQQMPALNLCGILYTGSDIGGFGCDATPDLMLRWLEFGIFTPLMRNHAALGTREQEVYQFEQLEDYRNIIRIRYGLLPYIYSEYMKSALNNEMYFRPLAFDFPQDSHTARVEDQLMVGESIMIAPVYTQNATGRYVYLPEDMLMIRMKSLEDKIYRVMQAGHHYIDAALNEVVFFVRKNHMLPLAVLNDDIRSTADLQLLHNVISQRKDAQEITAEDVMHTAASIYEWIGYAQDYAEYTLYDDDGISKNYTPQQKWIKVVKSKESLNVCIS